MSLKVIMLMNELRVLLSENEIGGSSISVKINLSRVYKLLEQALSEETTK